MVAAGQRRQRRQMRRRAALGIPQMPITSCHMPLGSSCHMPLGRADLAPGRGAFFGIGAE